MRISEVYGAISKEQKKNEQRDFPVVAKRIVCLIMGKLVAQKL
jgi:hypothetical protein